MPEFSADDSTITRFASESGKHRADGELHWRAFLPEYFEGRYELSTFWIDELAEPSIWRLAENRTPLARADFLTAICGRLEMRMELDAEKPRHVFVLEWPDEKGIRKMKAKQFAALVVEEGTCKLAAE